MKSRTSVAVLLCVLLAFAHSTPTGKKNSQSKKAELEKEINPSSKALDDDGDDDLLARAKKSSITTFCVEIKPDNDHPPVVVCEPSSNNQQPLPPAPPAHAHHHPDPQPEPQPDPGYSQYPQYPIIPDYPQVPWTFDPLQVFVPQVPQILSPCPQHPQIILVRDPSCPTNNPAIIPSPWQQSPYSGLAYPSRAFGRSAGGYPMNPAEFWKSGFAPEEDKSRSFTGPNGLPSTGFLSSLDTMHSNRGLFQPNSSPQSSQSQQLPNSQKPYEKPLLIQCNPSVIPLPQHYNSAAGAAGSGSYDQIRLSSAMTENMDKSSMEPTQYMYQPMAGGANGVYMSQGAMPYMRQSAMNNVDQYRSSALPPQSQNAEAVGMGPMTLEANPLGRATEQIQELLKNRQESQSSFGDRQHQGHQNVATDAGGSKALTTDQPQKIESAQSAQSVAGGMGGSVFAQGKNSFAQNAGDHQLQGTKSNDQGFQRQMTLSVGPQQQQQHQPNAAARNGGAEPNHFQQPLTHNQQRLQMMKAAVNNNNNNNNMLQPFSTQQSHSVGDKQTHLKV